MAVGAGELYVGQMRLCIKNWPGRYTNARLSEVLYMVSLQLKDPLRQTIPSQMEILSGRFLVPVSSQCDLSC